MIKCSINRKDCSIYVVDEDFDREVLDALERGDAAALGRLPENMFQSGTSEIKNWIVVAGAMAEAGLKMTLLDYVPCYVTAPKPEPGARWDSHIGVEARLSTDSRQFSLGIFST